MYDLQFVFPQEIVSLTSVRIAPGVSPRTLDVVGEDFRAVDEVLINDNISPNVVVASKTRLFAEVPAIVGANAIQTVAVVSRQLRLNARSLIRFRIGRMPSKVNGILRLMQIYLKILFTTPGSDIFSQNIGGDALRNVGRTFSKNQSGGIVSDFHLAVEATNRQIITVQGKDPNLPRDERLLSARVLSSHFSQAEAALYVSIEINSQAGRSAIANLMV